jgi:hypothetical protein
MYQRKYTSIAAYCCVVFACVFCVSCVCSHEAHVVRGGCTLRTRMCIMIAACAVCCVCIACARCVIMNVRCLIVQFITSTISVRIFHLGHHRSPTHLFLFSFRELLRCLCVILCTAQQLAATRTSMHSSILYSIPLLPLLSKSFMPGMCVTKLIKRLLPWIYFFLPFLFLFSSFLFLFGSSHIKSSGVLLLSGGVESTTLLHHLVFL